MSGAYYNEHDAFAAAWLRELIKAGHIAPGDVDERSIEDISPDELAGYVQCHFFAGIGVWSHALRLAGWPDDRAIWTGSCPCQPFSAAGKGAGFDDERHLWPAFFDLIQQCDPPIVIGEQVASKDGLAWLDLVSADVEGTGRSFAAADLCAAGFGAPHIRQRSFWVAHGDNPKRGTSPARRHDSHRPDSGRAQGAGDAQGRRSLVGLADVQSERRRKRSGEVPCSASKDASATSGQRHGDASWPHRTARQLADNPGEGLGWGNRLSQDEQAGGNGLFPARSGGDVSNSSGASRATNGFWFDADWLGCRDGKWRPVEPGTFPLAHGAANRVGRLRGYGNAIVGPVAQGFIEAVMDTLDERLAA